MFRGIVNWLRRFDVAARGGGVGGKRVETAPPHLRPPFGLRGVLSVLSQESS